jgi:hypothetical protein
MNPFRTTVVLALAALGLVAAAPADAPTLKDAEAEADRLDPGWRPADLKAKRARPLARDSGPLVLEILRLIPPEWKDLRPEGKGAATPARAYDGMTKLMGDDPTKPVPADLMAAARAVQAQYRPLIARARELEKYPAGYLPITYAHNPLATLLPHTQDVRTIARMLQFDALTRAASGDIDGALVSARAILGASRSIGDEPFAISQLVRMAIESVACVVTEQVLARAGQATDTALAATQTAFADEAGKPLLLYALRGERAANYELMEKLVSGKIKLPDLADMGIKLDPNRTKLDVPGDQAISLHEFNVVVEIAKKPLPEQPALWDRWQADFVKGATAAERERHALVYMLLPAFEPVSQAYLRTRAQLRAAETMVGLERFRRAKGHWPRPGEPLAPAFKEPPPDPFTGKPMLWKASPNGLAVYSVSYDRADSGGKLEVRNVKTPGTDIGLRLWDVNHRPRPVAVRR